MANTGKPADEQMKKVPAGPEKAEEGSAEWYNEKVPVRLFKDSNKYKDDVFVGVNGKGYLIQRGVEVMVPRFVAQVLSQSMDQDTATAELIGQKEEAFRTESAKLGL